jgi:hypothetical protein
MEEVLKESPIEVIAYTRAKNKEWNKGKKADVVICNKKNFGFSDPEKCAECEETCYHTTNDNQDLKKKNFKIICVDCVLDNEKYRKNLLDDQIKILEIARQ